jgi:16S rRNA (uracil1498-N3)-methyltransferase
MAADLYSWYCHFFATLLLCYKLSIFDTYTCFCLYSFFALFIMNLFYQPSRHVLELDEEESRHCTKVLRLATGSVIDVTDGEGLHQRCRITVGARKVSLEVIESFKVKRRPYSITIAVAPTRKTERNEWMVEKMTEIGVERIEFVVTEHTSREGLSRVVNMTRLNKIAVAAMKQSQQFYKPEITLINSVGTLIQGGNVADIRLIAYVPDNQSSEHVFQKIVSNQNTILLIGPEGDFSPGEVQMALNNGYETVSLGANRLRTETAAVAGCHAINMAQLILGGN